MPILVACFRIDRDQLPARRRCLLTCVKDNRTSRVQPCNNRFDMEQ